MKKTIFLAFAAALLLTGCKNGDKEFPDFVYQTISFAHQTPVRTLTMGDDQELDMTLDNAHQFDIMAVLGGVNTNKKDRWAEVEIDNSLVETINFDNGEPVVAMPANYYTIANKRLVIEKGKVLGGVRVQLTDAYFADPATVGVKYVIPLRLVNASDSILVGEAKDDVENPNRLNKDDWSITPKDYILYAVKYKNAYHGCWLSKGIDKINNNGATSQVDRRVDLWEKASLRYLTTKSLNTSVYSFEYDVPTTDADGNPSEKHITCNLLLTIDNNGVCSVSTDTPGCTASGSGQWTRKGEPKAWGDKDRDLLKLNYKFTIYYVANDQTRAVGTYTLESTEDLVMRDRQNKFEEFSFTLK